MKDFDCLEDCAIPGFNPFPTRLTLTAAGSAEPLCQMAHKVKEEVALRDTDDLVADHNE